MKRLILVGLAALLAAAAAAGAVSPVPGGPAPKQLLGTWRTTLTRADELRSADPAHWPNEQTWELVIVNSSTGVDIRALGLRPRGEGGDSMGFGVSGNRLFVRCLDVNAIPTAGYGTYAWSLTNGKLRLRLVKEPCRDPLLRNRITILTRHAWKKGK
jgi:hypothetical protein